LFFYLAFYIHAVQHLASVAAHSDEEEVVNVMCSKTGLVEVDRHVDVPLVGHGQEDVSVVISSGRQCFHKAVVVIARVQRKEEDT